MAKTLDFNALKKQYLPVVLRDEDNTKLFISSPPKRVLDKFLQLHNTLSDNSVGEEAIEEMYTLVAEIMSYNKTGAKITKEKLESIMDFEDIFTFIYAYTDFIAEVSGGKNS